MKVTVEIVCGMLLICQMGKGQSFLELNFEQAVFVPDPSGFGYYTSNAIPGWTAYDGTFALTDVYSNDFSLSGGSISIIGTNWIYPQIQGKYFALLAGFNFPGLQRTAELEQVGQIPLNASSLTFWGSLNGGTVSFNGQTLSAFQIGTTANYDVYGTDISTYAGQTGQLAFTTALGSSLEIDNIQFSPLPVPEPGVLGLSAVGGLFLVWRRGRKYLQI